MKLVLRLTEKPKGESFKFSKLTVQWENVFLEFSERGIEHINLFSVDEEKNIVTIDRVTKKGEAMSLFFLLSFSSKIVLYFNLMIMENLTN